MRASLSHPVDIPSRDSRSLGAPLQSRVAFGVPPRLLFQLVGVFLAYVIAGKLGQATTNIRSSNLGPVWPASGVAMAGLLAYGARFWPVVAAGAFVVASSSSVSMFAAAGQAIGAGLATFAGAHFLRSYFHLDPRLSRLRDALAFIVVGAFASSVISASIGILSLYAAGVQPYSGIGAAWLIYWLGDATGVLLVTPLMFTGLHLVARRSRDNSLRLGALVALIVASCFIIFGDLPLVPVRLHAFAFAMLPLVMWAGIDFGVGGASLSVFLIATIATLATAFGHGPFTDRTPFVNAVLLDVLFTVFAVSGITLAAVISEREQAKGEREELIRAQASVEARLRLAAIVESSNDAIVSMDLDGIILTWNDAAHRIFGFTQDEAIGHSATMLFPPDRRSESIEHRQRLKAGERIARHESIRATKSGQRIAVAVTQFPLADATGRLIGCAEIARDVTQLKQTEKALAAAREKLARAHDEERARIARDLHDDIGQRLSVVSIGLSELLFGSAGLQRSRATTLQQQVSEIANDVNALSRELHPPKVELLGLTAAMKSFCRESAAQYHVNIDVDADGVPDDLPVEISLALFRVLQEAVHNAAKYSGVEALSVRLGASDTEVQLIVSDGGAGFDLSRARAGSGLGLLSMQERLSLVGGSLLIATTPGKGTRIHARVPRSF